MRSFAYKNENFEKSSYVPDLKEGNPCYQASVYDTVMYDETLDGDLIQCDMTQILLNQEKYRRLLGDMNVQAILAQMHPTQTKHSVCLLFLPYLLFEYLYSLRSDFL